jgi:hypothetical protein
MHPLFLARLGVDPVSMTWRLADDKHAYKSSAAIQSLMLLAWRDLESFTGLKNEIAMVYFKG